MRFWLYTHKHKDGQDRGIVASEGPLQPTFKDIAETEELDFQPRSGDEMEVLQITDMLSNVRQVGVQREFLMGILSARVRNQ
jgi:hypothetical protein